MVVLIMEKFHHFKLTNMVQLMRYKSSTRLRQQPTI